MPSCNSVSDARKSHVIAGIELGAMNSSGMSLG